MIWFYFMKKNNSLIEDKRKDQAQTHQNKKGHPTGEFFCRGMKWWICIALNFGNLLEFCFYIQLPDSIFLLFSAAFHGLVLFCKGGFHNIAKMLLG